MIKISKYLDEALIFFMHAETKIEALTYLIETVVHTKELREGSTFHQAILEREKIVSTGIGMGVAIPHAKLPFYDDFFIAIGVLDKGVEWNALDGFPVRLLFLIGGPDDKQTEYLKILSSLTTAIKEEERRKLILAAPNPREVLKFFQDF